MHLSTEEGANTIQGMAHEFFHLWNAKRIRPLPLGPFDYTQLPHTGTLWWIEGVTDYYSALLPYRYGAWNRDAFPVGVVHASSDWPGDERADPIRAIAHVPMWKRTI
jgi:hypothetical protein